MPSQLNLVRRRKDDSAPTEFAHPRIFAICKWFEMMYQPQLGGLTAGCGPGDFFEPSHSFFLKKLGNYDCGWRVLDLGCGDGLDAIALSASTNRAWGVDIAQRRVAEAQSNVAKANKSDRVLVGMMDAHNLEFDEDFFDLIIANSFLMWVNKARVIEECHRVLKEGGRIIFSMETMVNNPFLRLHRRRRLNRVREKLVSRITLQDLHELSLRFSTVSWKQFYFLSPLFYPLALRFPKSRIVNVLVKSIQLLDDMILHRFPNLRRYAWVSVIEATK